MSRMELGDDLRQLSGRLSRLSADGHYNPYTHFDWPEKIDDDAFWMTPGLLSTYGTEVHDELSLEQKKRLSKFESLNFYSLNVHGIRELIIEVTRRIHVGAFADVSDFMHHFLGEENEHMWFFAEFCRRYAGGLYPERAWSSGPNPDREVESLLVFARITIFEEIVDYFNAQMAQDANLPAVVREINAVHHREESRHIAFGRSLLVLLHRRIRQRGNPAELQEVERYLMRYVEKCIGSLYNPACYRDAGITTDGMALRDRLLEHPGRAAFHRQLMARTAGFLTKNEIVTSPWALSSKPGSMTQRGESI
jgi:hypothetical protein